MSINKKALAGLLIAIILSMNTGCVGSSGEAPINWLNYNEGLSQAKTENKPILINFESAWCGACRKLDRGTFQDEQVFEESTGFVCIKVDIGKRGGLTRKYRIMATPTTIFLDSQGKEVDRIIGYADRDNFLQIMELVLSREEILGG
jgi:thiol:disulfide interchange protein DsbD